MKIEQRTKTLKVTRKRLDGTEIPEGEMLTSSDCGPWYLHQENGNNYACKQCVAGHPPTAWPYTECIELE